MNIELTLEKLKERLLFAEEAEKKTKALRERLAETNTLSIELAKALRQKSTEHWNAAKECKRLRDLLARIADKATITCYCATERQPECLICEARDAVKGSE